MGSFKVYINDISVEKNDMGIASDIELRNLDAMSFSSLRLAGAKIPVESALILTTLKVYEKGSGGDEPVDLNSCPSNVGVPICIWGKPHYKFMTDAETQTLIVILDAVGYCLHSVTSDDPSRTVGIRPRDAAGDFGDIVSHGTKFPGDPTEIAIVFKIPRRSRSFKFHASVRKLSTGEVHDADPQVGNDPPANNNPPPGP